MILLILCVFWYLFTTSFLSLFGMCSCLELSNNLCTHTHTDAHMNTHTYKDRERERDGEMHADTNSPINTHIQTYTNA